MVEGLEAAGYGIRAAFVLENLTRPKIVSSDLSSDEVLIFFPYIDYVISRKRVGS